MAVLSSVRTAVWEPVSLSPAESSQTRATRALNVIFTVAVDTSYLNMLCGVLFG